MGGVDKYSVFALGGVRDGIAAYGHLLEFVEVFGVIYHCLGGFGQEAFFVGIMGGN